VALGRGSELQLDMALANKERRGSCSTSVAMAHGSKKASVAAFAVRFGSVEKIKGEGGRGVLAGCTTQREEVGAWPDVACGTTEGRPWHHQPMRAAGAGSGQAARKAREWGNRGWQVGWPGGWGPDIERQEGREEERPMGGTSSGWDPLAGRRGRER
jgi:hypothetical protein